MLKSLILITDKKESCLQDSPPAAGRFKRHLPFHRSAILPGGLFVSLEHYGVISYDIKNLIYKGATFMAKIDHAAIRTSSYEDAQKFFEDVFDMHMWREIGEKPERKCWFREGIQLCEVSAVNTEAENGYDHISIAVDSVEETMEKIKAYSVKPINDHWFSLPDGTRIELKLLANWKVND